MMINPGNKNSNSQLTKEFYNKSMNCTLNFIGIFLVFVKTKVMKPNLNFVSKSLYSSHINQWPIVGDVAGIYPCYRGRNGSLPSIGQKGRFLRVKNVEKKLNRKESK